MPAPKLLKLNHPLDFDEAMKRVMKVPLPGPKKREKAPRKSKKQSGQKSGAR